jgi:hypothetical protein
MMTNTAYQIWGSFCNELIVEPTEDMKQALSYAIRVVAERFCTDWGELQHPSTVLEEIADEVDAL